MQGDGTALAVSGLARRFGRRWVLRGVDLEAGPGEIVALTGRNGSGKTTLLRICATALRPTRGTARIFGHDVVKDAGEVREHVGLLGHAAGLYDDLTALENLSFAQRMAGVAPELTQLRLILEDVGLARDAESRVRGFSAGMRRRLALARLLLRPPRLLLLDEPFASFDADGILRVNRFALDVAAAGGIVLVATHDVRRGSGVFTRRVHIHEGRALPGDLDVEDLSLAEAGGP